LLDADADTDPETDNADISFTIVFSISSDVADGFIAVSFFSDFLGSFTDVTAADVAVVDIALRAFGALVAIVCVVFLFIDTI
jgi:hypothetical protein